MKIKWWIINDGYGIQHKTTIKKKIVYSCMYGVVVDTVSSDKRKRKKEKEKRDNISKTVIKSTIIIDFSFNDKRGQVVSGEIEASAEKIT